MRNILILLLAAAVVWLFMERVRLSDELAAAKKELGAGSPEAEAGSAHAATGSGPGAKSGSKSDWLNKHIDSGARSLDAPKPGRH